MMEPSPLERWRQMANIRGKRKPKRNTGPEGCVQSGIVADAIFLDRYSVVKLCRAGVLEGVDGPMELTKPNGKKRAVWVTKASLERYMETHKEEIALRALKKGILR